MKPLIFFCGHQINLSMQAAGPVGLSKKQTALAELHAELMYCHFGLLI